MPEHDPSSYKFSRRTLFRFAGVKGLEHFLGEIPSVSWSETDKTPESVRKFVENIVTTPPLIGTNENAGKELEFGKGWATFHLHENSPILHTVIKNRLLDIKNHSVPTQQDQNILRLEKHLPKEFIINSQSNLSPQEAFDSQKYIGYLATRGRNDIGKEYVIFKQNTPTSPVEFAGIGLCIDNSGSGRNLYKPYKLDGWNTAGYQGKPIEWMIDASANLIKNLPLGRAPSPDYLMGGRPGVIIVSRQIYDNLVRS